MKFSDVLGGARLLELEPIGDERGFFARTWCTDEARGEGLVPQIEQCSVSFNRQRGTLRGLHYQREPFAEQRLVRVTRGAIWDVVVDIRPGSETFGQWFGVELTADNRKQLLVPEGFAHGFQTLVEDSEVLYMMSTPYHAELQAGIHHADPSLAIEWPLEISTISERDQELPHLEQGSSR